jgi:hypothetical protein
LPRRTFEKGYNMAKKLKDLLLSELETLPISNNHSNLGDELIHLHLWNAKKMNWYLAEYSPISKKFFGYLEDPRDTLSSGSYSIDDILSYSERGDDWEPMVDEGWKPIAAKEIVKLQGYIELMSTGTDDFT